MRWLLLVLALGAAAATGYLETQGRTSYSGYSDLQLAMLEQELGQQMRKQGRVAEHLVTEQFLQDERQRRARARLALAVTGGLGLAALGAFLLRGLGAWRAHRATRREEAQGRQALGGSPQDARARAAALLGVSPQAPATVIEAALQAQLRERDVSRLDGLAPDLQRMMLEQREELIRARDLLLR
jgi:hypothetical protein